MPVELLMLLEQAAEREAERIHERQLPDCPILATLLAAQLFEWASFGGVRILGVSSREPHVLCLSENGTDVRYAIACDPRTLTVKPASATAKTGTPVIPADVRLIVRDIRLGADTTALLRPDCAGPPASEGQREAVALRDAILSADRLSGEASESQLLLLLHDASGLPFSSRHGLVLAGHVWRPGQHLRPTPATLTGRPSALADAGGIWKRLITKVPAGPPLLALGEALQRLGVRGIELPARPATEALPAFASPLGV